MGKYSSMVGENAGPDAVFLTALKKEIVPTYEQYIEKLESINPQTDELINIHAILIDGAKDQLASFHLTIKAIENGSNKGIIEQANKKLDSGKKKIGEWESKLHALCKANKVNITK